MTTNDYNISERASRVVEVSMRLFIRAERQRIATIGYPLEHRRQLQALNQIIEDAGLYDSLIEDAHNLRARDDFPDPPVLELPTGFPVPNNALYQAALQDFSEARTFFAHNSLRDADALDQELYHQQTQLTLAAHGYIASRDLDTRGRIEQQQRREYTDWRRAIKAEVDLQSLPVRPTGEEIAQEHATRNDGLRPGDLTASFWTTEPWAATQARLR
jgi:hypothetical protein